DLPYRGHATAPLRRTASRRPTPAGSAIQSTTLGQSSRRSSAPRSRQRLETAHPSERVRHSAQQSSQQKRWSKRRSRSGTNDPSSRSSELFGSNGLRQQRQCSHVAHPQRFANMGVKARSDEHAEQEARRTTWHADIVHEG